MNGYLRLLLGTVVGSLVLVVGLLWLLSSPALTAEEIAQTGSIHGALQVEMEHNDGVWPIQIPGFEVRAQSDTSTAITVTDEYGRFVFAELPYGEYQISVGNSNWTTEAFAESVVISPAVPTVHLPPVAVTPINSNLQWGRVRFTDGTSPWFRDHHFGITQTAQVALLDTDGSQLTEPILTNAWGEFVLSNAPEQFAEVRVQLDISSSLDIEFPETIIPTVTSIITSPVIITISGRRPEFILSASLSEPDIPRELLQSFIERVREPLMARFRAFTSPLSAFRLPLPAPGLVPEFIRRRFPLNKELSIRLVFDPHIEGNEPPNEAVCKRLHWKPADGKSDGCKVRLWKPPTTRNWYRIDALLFDPSAGAHARSAIVIEANDAKLAKPYELTENPTPTITRCLLRFKGGVDVSSSCPAIPNLHDSWCDHACQAQLAEKYYRSIDPFAKRTTLGDWWAINGFDPFTGEGGVQAVYQNHNDLGFGRNMNCNKRGNDVACYVVNYGIPRSNEGDNNACLAQENARRKALATVAMEYSPIDGQKDSEPIVKFYAFAGGEPEDERVTTVDLEHNPDVYKNTYVPNLCLNCHGGSHIQQDNPDKNAYFLPFDMASVRNVDADECEHRVGIPSQHTTDETRAQAFKNLNQMVLDTNPNKVIKDLICGWYGERFDCRLTDISDYSQDEGYIPAGWHSNEALYLEVVKPYCRTCHIALDAKFDSDPQFNLAYARQGFSRRGTYKSMCGKNRTMPHTLVTYRNFWDTEGNSARAKLEEFWTESRFVTVEPQNIVNCLRPDESN